MTEQKEKSVSPYLTSFFMESITRTQFIYKAELAFVGVFLINSFFELILSETSFICLLMFLMACILALLYLEFYFGSVYNCVPLLNLHTFSASFVAFWCWFACLYPMLFMDILYTSSMDVRNTVYKYYACLIIFGSLLVSFSVASLNRTREIKAVELAHLDHIRKLLINANETVKMVKSEPINFAMPNNEALSNS